MNFGSSGGFDQQNQQIGASDAEGGRRKYGDQSLIPVTVHQVLKASKDMSEVCSY